MADRRHVALVRTVQQWNEWRKEHRSEVPNLSGAHLNKADLSGADLSEANLRGANLRRATLSAANLAEANLSAANLRVANLRAADLRGAVLWEADLSEAHLRWANFGGADLSGADLNMALLDETVFGNTNLWSAKGLSECKFEAPCVLDHRTLQRSGMLPLPFLRGCGLPDALIEYLPSLLNSAVQFDSCFISYSTKDQAFAERLYGDLQNKGVRCWFAPHDIRGGHKIHEQIDAAIQIHDRLLLILSRDSMASDWVKTELQRQGRESCGRSGECSFRCRWCALRIFGSGSASMGIQERIAHRRSVSTSFRTSATGRITTPTRQRSSDY